MRNNPSEKILTAPVRHLIATLLSAALQVLVVPLATLTHEEETPTQIVPSYSPDTTPTRLGLAVLERDHLEIGSQMMGLGLVALASQRPLRTPRTKMKRLRESNNRLASSNKNP